MPALALESSVKVIDLSKLNGPSSATVVAIPLPKNTVGIVFGVSIPLYVSFPEAGTKLCVYFHFQANDRGVGSALQYVPPRHELHRRRPTGFMGCVLHWVSLRCYRSRPKEPSPT